MSTARCDYEDLFGKCGHPARVTAELEPRWGGTRPLCTEHHTIINSLIKADPQRIS